jgi:hypothetical protein
VARACYPNRNHASSANSPSLATPPPTSFSYSLRYRANVSCVKARVGTATTMGHTVFFFFFHDKKFPLLAAPRAPSTKGIMVVSCCLSVMMLSSPLIVMQEVKRIRVGFLPFWQHYQTVAGAAGRRQQRPTLSLSLSFSLCTNLGRVLETITRCNTLKIRGSKFEMLNVDIEKKS